MTAALARTVTDPATRNFSFAAAALVKNAHGTGTLHALGRKPYAPHLRDALDVIETVLAVYDSRTKANQKPAIRDEDLEDLRAILAHADAAGVSRL
jgi:hypothetical protein